MSRERVRDEAVKTLTVLGMTDQQKQLIAASPVLEVSIPFQGDPKLDGLPAMIPWEHLLSSVAKACNANESLVVVRHLRLSSKLERKLGKSTSSRDDLSLPKRFAFVGATPDRFSEFHEYAAERDLVTSGLHPVDPVFIPSNPTRASLERLLGAEKPDVLHFTGVDTHLGEQVLALYSKAEMKFYRDTFDGIFLPQGNGQHEKLQPDQFAIAMLPAAHRPMLASINTWYSGARIAPSLVANGVEVAIGFQNTFDARAANLFFLRFYQEWLSSGLDIASSFRQAWQAIDPYKKKIKGNAITLWQRRSIFDRSSTKKKNRLAKAKLKVRQADEGDVSQRPADPALDRASELIGVRVVPETQLNIALMHNRRSVLKELYLWFKRPPLAGQICEVQEIEVEVRLDVGNESFPYRTSVTLDCECPQIDLADASVEAKGSNQGGGVCVPVTASLLENTDERLLANLFVEVKWHDQILYRHSHSVDLAPVDEWKFDVVNNGWLPSFVRPRDPAVKEIISSATKYLKAIQDDPSASFCGYQADDVEPQVRAIWSAIVNDFRLNYVSPPPAYRDYSQRLRSPREVLREKNGTCVDLSILMASCLEWIELSPVIFMSNIHAFPGYWVSAEAHEKFLASKSMPPLDDRTYDERDIAETFPWAVGFKAFGEVSSLVADLELKPMESVSLTSYSGFEAANAEGVSYFDEDAECFMNPKRPGTHGGFESLIDIVSSRKYVTPIPISSRDRSS